MRFQFTVGEGLENFSVRKRFSRRGENLFYSEVLEMKVNILDGNWGKESLGVGKMGDGGGRGRGKMLWSAAPLDLLAEKQRESWDCMVSVCVLLSLCLRPSSTELPSPVERGGATMAGN